MRWDTPVVCALVATLRHHPTGRTQSDAQMAQMGAAAFTALERKTPALRFIIYRALPL